MVRFRRVVFWIAGVPLMLGVFMVFLLSTPPATRIIVRKALPIINRQLNGSLSVDEIHGSLFGRLDFGGVTLKDRSGVTLARADRLVIGYRILDLIQGHIQVDPVILERPDIELVQSEPGEPYPLMQVFQTGHPSSSARSDIAVRGLTIKQGTLVATMPTRARAAGGEPAPGSAPLLDTVRVTGLNIKMPLLRFASGGSAPTSAEMRVDEASAQSRNPTLSLRALRGRVAMEGDSIVVALKDAQLPNTQLTADGWMLTGGKKPVFTGDIHIAHLNTTDFVSLAPTLPPNWRLGGDVHAISDRAGAIYAELKNLEITADGDGGGAVRGHIAMNIAPDGHWRQRDTRLLVDNVDVARVLRRFNQTAAVTGRLRGNLAVTGPQDSLNVRTDLVLRQASPDSAVESRVAGGGIVSVPLGGVLAFHHVRIDTASVDLRQLKSMNPRMPLTGRLDVRGGLDGSMRDMTFDGGLHYREANLPPSDVRGTVRLAYHSPLHITADVELDSLRLAGFQQSFPSLAGAGAIGGHVRLSGPLDTLNLLGEIGGEPGQLRLEGTFGMQPGVLTVRNFTGKADSFNLAAINPRLPHSTLFATIAADARLRGKTMEDGTIRFSVDSSSIDRMGVKAATVVARAAGGLLSLDTLLVHASGINASGSGTLGLTGEHRGTLTFRLKADSLDALSALLEKNASMAQMAPHSGSLVAEATVTGSVDAYQVQFKADTKQLTTPAAGMRTGTVSGSWTVPEQRFALKAAIDSLVTKSFSAKRIDAAAQGTFDSLVWQGSALFTHNGKISGAGAVSGDSSRGRLLLLDSLTLSRDSAHWRLERPARVELRDDRWAFTNTILVRQGAGAHGRVAITGTLSARDSSGHISGTIEEFPLADLAIFPARPKAPPLNGMLSAQFDLSGSPRNPTGTGQLALIGAKFDTIPLPELRGKASYLSGVLDADASIVTRGGPTTLQAHVPLSSTAADHNARLAFNADHMDISWLDPFLPTIQNLAGVLNGQVQMVGSFDHPELSGGMTLTGGEGTVLSAGVHYHDVAANLSFAGNSIRVDHMSVASQEGRGEDSLVVTGAVRLEQITNPVVDLEAKAENFQVMRSEDLLDGSATGDLKMSGPLYGARLTGRVRAGKSVMHVDQFIQKRVIDLSDSLFAQFVDTTVLRREKLTEDPVTMLMDSLHIDSLVVSMGDDFWLRSDQANIQLGGALRLSKTGKQYIINGTVSTLRGTYSLRLAPGVSKEFQINAGSIRYFGSPDLDAILDINAQYELQTSAGDPMTVLVHITGTVLQPQIELTSDAHPPLEQSEVISYLIFGAPSFQAFMNDRSGEQRSMFEQSVNAFSGALSGQLAETLGGWLPLDYFKIQPGEIQNGLSGTQLIMGKQVSLFGKPSWLKASPRICPRESMLSMDQIGLSLETRLSRQWGLAASLDPMQGCETTLPPTSTHYGLGLDVFFERRGLRLPRILGRSARTTNTALDGMW